MKNKLPLILCVIAAALYFSGDAFAQKVKDDFKKNAYLFDYEVRLGWGGYPVTNASDFSGGRNRYVDMMPPPDDPRTLQQIYADHYGNAYMTGVFAAEFDMNFRKWFSLTLGVGLNGMYRDVYDVDNRKIGQYSGVYMSILPEVRFSYINRTYFRMYSGVGLGLSLKMVNDNAINKLETTPGVAFQLTPVGVTVGRNVYGFAELGIGTQFMGMMVGIGFRFN